MRIKEESTSKSFMILTVATFLTKIMSLIYVPLLLNIIQAEAHGVYTTAYEFFAFAYVITNETRKASDYITKFAKLIRLILHYASKDAILLQSELEG